MIPVKVVSIGEKFEVKTKYGIKEMVKMVVEQLDTKEKHEASYFLSKDGLPTVGQEILADIVKSGEYTNLKKWEVMGIKNVPQGTPQQTIKPFPNISERKFTDKDVIIVRQNVLSHATELVKDAQSFQEAKDLSKMAQEVKSVAEELEKWVFRGF